MTKTFFITSTILLAGQFTIVQAKDAVDNAPQVIIDSTAIKRVPPKYPKSAIGKEGWVKLSYIVEKDGSVSSPVVESSSGIKGFEKAALKSIKKWQFNPATIDGKPIQQCKNSVQMSFKMSGKSHGASRKFVRKYKQINDLLADNKLDQVKEKLTELKEKPKWNFYEESYFLALSALYYQATNDKNAELATLGHMIPAGAEYLPKSVYSSALVRAFSLTTEKNKYSSALYYYKQLQKQEGSEQYSAQLKPYAEKVKNVIQSDTPIAITAKIDGKNFWHHRLVRSDFAFSDIKGQVDTVEVRCDNKRSTFNVTEEKSWSIPDSWGKCQLFVYGENNSQFSLVELQKELKVAAVNS